MVEELKNKSKNYLIINVASVTNDNSNSNMIIQDSNRLSLFSTNSDLNRRHSSSFKSNCINSSNSSLNNLMIRAPSFEVPKNYLTIKSDQKRPITARSLPSKVVQNENDKKENENRSTDEKYDKLKSPPQIKLINVGTKVLNNDDCSYLNMNNTNNQDINSCNNNDIKHSISSSISSPVLNSYRKSSSSAMKSVNQTLKQNQEYQTKTNLDHFLDYSLSPFTTKYEIIGENKGGLKNAKSAKKLESNETSSKMTNLNIDDSNNVRRTRSISNLNDKKNPIKVENIVLPGHVKPYTISYGNETQVSNFEDLNKTNFYRITEDLYCGNINSIKNERKMCKLNIEYLIDMTNMRPDDLNRQTLGKLPCLCKRQHSRLYLSVEIIDTSFKSLFNAFSEVNKFIQRARKAPNDKNVLIFGREMLSPQVITAGSQYLMVEYEMDLETALQTVTQKNYSHIKSKLEKCYLDYLKEFESYLKHMSVNLYGNFNYKFNQSYSENKRNGSSGYSIKINKQKQIIRSEKGNYDEDDDYGEDDVDDDDEYDDYDDDDYLEVESDGNENEMGSGEFVLNKNGKLGNSNQSKQNTFSNLMQSGANQIEKNLNNQINKTCNSNSNLKLAWM